MCRSISGHGVIHFLCEMMNPFNQTDNERLHNIATGKAEHLYTEKVLLTVTVNKDIKRLSKCKKRPERFEERIVKQKIQTLETELGTKKNSKDPNGKVFFLRELVLAVFCVYFFEEKIDAIAVLS